MIHFTEQQVEDFAQMMAKLTELRDQDFSDETVLVQFDPKETTLLCMALYLMQGFPPVRMFFEEEVGNLADKIADCIEVQKLDKHPEED